jgi:uncharacterized protein
MVTTKIDFKSLASEIAERLEPQVHLQKVVLFGSYDRGNAHEWSDIDFALISNDFKKMSHGQRIVFLVTKLKGIDSRIEVLTYSLDEHEIASHLTFLGEIKLTGKIIYGAGLIPRPDPSGLPSY